MIDKKYITLGEWDKKKSDDLWKVRARKKRDRMEDEAFERGDCDTTKEFYQAYGYNPRRLNIDE